VVVAFGITGFWSVLMNPPGPAHEYVIVPGKVEEDCKLILSPLQTVIALGAACTMGVPYIRTATEPGAD
jgi:hypothetical protein